MRKPVFTVNYILLYGLLCFVTGYVGGVIVSRIAFSPSEEPGLAGSQSVGPAHIKIEDAPGLVIKDCTFSEPNAPVQLYRVTAYCPGPCCCGKWADGLTASGKPAVGLIVAAPKGVAFGTALLIPGYGVASVQDRGGAITGNRLDVLFPTHAEAKQWGVQELMVREVRK